MDEDELDGLLDSLIEAEQEVMPGSMKGQEAAIDKYSEAYGRVRAYVAAIRAERDRLAAELSAANHRHATMQSLLAEVGNHRDRLERRVMELQIERDRLAAIILEADSAFNRDGLRTETLEEAVGLVRMCHEGRAAMDELAEVKAELPGLLERLAKSNDELIRQARIPPRPPGLLVCLASDSADARAWLARLRGETNAH